MTIGVISITVVYLLVNYAFLRVMPLDEMRANPTLVASRVAEAAFGQVGILTVNTLMWISIFGALGGLIMTLPRLCYATVSDYVETTAGTIVGPLFRSLAHVSPKTAVPSGSLVFVGAAAIVALLFFGSFSRIVSFILIPLQFISIIMVSSVFILRPRLATSATFRTPGYPWVPVIYIAVVGVLLISAIVFNPIDSLIGVALTMAAVPIYYFLHTRGANPLP